MRERVRRYFEDFEKALKNLAEAVYTAETDLEIDGAIKRFELCYELSWKLMKEWLSDMGIICNSPRICFKYAYENDLIGDENVWLDMINDRNLLVHTYTVEQSREIFIRIRDEYLKAFEHLYNKIKEEKNEDDKSTM